MLAPSDVHYEVFAEHRKYSVFKGLQKPFIGADFKEIEDAPLPPTATTSLFPNDLKHFLQQPHYSEEKQTKRFKDKIPWAGYAINKNYPAK